MGARTGKTAASFDTVVELNAFPCLIICPLSVIATWENFLHAEGFRDEQVCSIRPKSRDTVIHAQNIMNINADIFLVNYESLESMDVTNFRSTWHSAEDLKWHSHYGTPLPDRTPAWLGLTEWKSIIADESYKFANPDSSISKYLLKRPYITTQHRFCLSAAQASEIPFQFAPAHIWMYGEFFGFDDPIKYCEKYWEYDEDSFKFYPKNKQHLEDIKAVIHRRDFSLKMSDLGLGCVPLQTRRFLEPDKATTEWLNWVDTCILYEHPETGEETEMIAPTKRIYNQKVASGLNPLTDELISTIKFADTLQYWKDKQEPLLIGCRFTAQIYYGAEFLHQAGMRVAVIDGSTKVAEREKLRQDFQDGKLDAIIGQQSTIQMGLDFSNLGDIICWSNEESGQVRIQLMERGNRVDRTDPYNIIDVCISGSKDEDISKNIWKKEKMYISYHKSAI
jgi:SNF2 family DNA or RNA helicase